MKTTILAAALALAAFPVIADGIDPVTKTVTVTVSCGFQQWQDGDGILYGRLPDAEQTAECVTGTTPPADHGDTTPPPSDHGGSTLPPPDAGDRQVFTRGILVKENTSLVQTNVLMDCTDFKWYTNSPQGCYVVESDATLTITGKADGQKSIITGAGVGGNAGSGLYNLACLRGASRSNIVADGLDCRNSQQGILTTGNLDLKNTVIHDLHGSSNPNSVHGIYAGNEASKGNCVGRYDNVTIEVDSSNGSALKTWCKDVQASGLNLLASRSATLDISGVFGGSDLRIDTSVIAKWPGSPNRVLMIVGGEGCPAAGESGTVLVTGTAFVVPDTQGYYIINKCAAGVTVTLAADVVVPPNVTLQGNVVRQ